MNYANRNYQLKEEHKDLLSLLITKGGSRYSKMPGTLVKEKNYNCNFILRSSKGAFCLTCHKIGYCTISRQKSCYYWTDWITLSEETMLLQMYTLLQCRHWNINWNSCPRVKKLCQVLQQCFSHLFIVANWFYHSPFCSLRTHFSNLILCSPTLLFNVLRALWSSLLSLQVLLYSTSHLSALKTQSFKCIRSGVKNRIKRQLFN